MEKKWFFQDDEETEVLIEMSYLAECNLINEVVQDLIYLKR